MIKFSTILIVEDNKDIINTLTIMLEGYGYSIVGKAFDGETAINIFRSLNIKPKVVLMDHRLPNKSGVETAIEILKIHTQVKIIIVTADKEIEERALEIGVFGVITKPFVFDNLVQCIESALNSY